MKRKKNDKSVEALPTISSIFEARSTGYALNIFAPEEIAALKLIEKRGKLYLKCHATGKDRLAKPEEIVRQADMAMYEAKRRGGYRHQLYTEELESSQPDDSLHLQSDLRRAIEQEELVLHYQPIVDLAGTQIVGVEALVRWEHPIHGMLLPSSFIPLAENAGLIIQLDRWVLERGCEDVQRLIETLIELGGHPGPAVGEIRSADLHYVDLETLLPRVLADQQQMAARYGEAVEALQECGPACEIAGQIAGHHRTRVEYLRKLADSATAGA